MLARVPAAAVRPWLTLASPGVGDQSRYIPHRDEARVRRGSAAPKEHPFFEPRSFFGLDLL